MYFYRFFQQFFLKLVQEYTIEIEWDIRSFSLPVLVIYSYIPNKMLL